MRIKLSLLLLVVVAGHSCDASEPVTGDVPILTKAEERQLFTKASKGDENAYLRLIGQYLVTKQFDEAQKLAVIHANYSIPQSAIWLCELRDVYQIDLSQEAQSIIFGNGGCRTESLPLAVPKSRDDSSA